MELEAKQDTTEQRTSEPTAMVRIYTYKDLMDDETYLSVDNRLAELRSKPDLTEEEKAEFNSMYPAWFRHFYDPI
jgi:hypothetical protein